jgi:hypothetical protein
MHTVEVWHVVMWGDRFTFRSACLLSCVCVQVVSNLFARDEHSICRTVKGEHRFNTQHIGNVQPYTSAPLHTHTRPRTTHTLSLSHTPPPYTPVHSHTLTHSLTLMPSDLSIVAIGVNCVLSYRMLLFGTLTNTHTIARSQPTFRNRTTNHAHRHTP